MILLILRHLVILSEDRKEMIEVLLAEEAIPLESTIEDILFSLYVFFDAGRVGAMTTGRY